GLLRDEGRQVEKVEPGGNLVRQSEQYPASKHRDWTMGTLDFGVVVDREPIRDRHEPAEVLQATPIPGLNLALRHIVPTLPNPACHPPEAETRMGQSDEMSLDGISLLLRFAQKLHLGANRIGKDS